ncbi:Holliday junction branch migration protein RuvA [Demequina sp. SYSU T00039]|uniref:Holliday junction branch migration complex subunit RuvA n=1 Tax=Demequina lignilytica TaxID=3051663 RepID=A0AAW7M4Q0_9MICO|nr:MULTISPECIES: Holliday junction branch migration protein RuvA [unclassified Demequina]MDN4486736.1 Holliday junction branch migration protein RuvA [Demequina sp. SYSU T00039]MDN4489420.1 Holliday junction branch migration protein RuvA [Demequina sp. SYSU T00068]
MIAQLTGTVAHVGASAVILDVAGVGYRILATPASLGELHAGRDVTVHTHMVVREDSMTLFGFLSAGERDTFEQLQSVQGVGAKLALAMLAVHSPEALASAVAAGDQKALTKVPGIGPKVASRLLLELGGKLVLPEAGASAGAPATAADARGEVVEALVGLGYAARQAQAAVDAVAPDEVAAAEAGSTLRAALKHLGGTRG